MIRKVKTSSDFRCEKCCYKETKECASVDCGGCYYTDKPSAPNRTRPRKSRDRRLLEAICMDSDTIELLEFRLNEKQYNQLIAIKEAMRKEGGK